MAWTWCRQRRRLGAGDRDRERVFIASEGELVRERAWPEPVATRRTACPAARTADSPRATDPSA
jgi:hypothetical protein